MRQLLAWAIGLLLLTAAFGPANAGAATCPNANPVVNENQCKTGSSAWQVNEYSKNLGGFTTRSSVDLGESVTLKIGRNGPVSPTRTVNIQVYRMGYYQGTGGRLVHSASNVAINNDYACKAMDPTTGLVDCGNWAATYTIPGSALPASGVYLAKLTASTGDQTQVVFTVRDDKRATPSKLLYVLPVASYQAYNLFGGKSLYWGYEGENTASGTDRAVKVSFNRPYAQAGARMNWFIGPDFELLFWLEKQGYDVSYTDDVQVHAEPAQLRNHDTVVVSGHSEYWSLPQFDGFLKARDAGVNIASFSANTAYWKVRYEDGNRTLVCYKTVQGSGTEGNGTVSDNDWGPDGLKGTADDALGLDGKAGTADDNPQNSTTTFRDNGAPPGDPSAPAGGRVGPDMPENQLFGVMYFGDNDARNFPLTIPAGNAADEFAADRIWRNTGISENTTTSIGERLVGWEWDAIPTQAQYLAHQPANVIKLSSSNVQTAPDNSWIQDEGRLRNTTPPPGQPGTVNAVKYQAPSGALVFAGGTMQWSEGLVDEPDDRIEQATYNVLSDMGAQPETPEGITLDPGGSNRAPNGSFTATPNPVKTNTQVTFDASASTDPDGTIVKYEWDLDGNGSYETNTGSNPKATRSYTSEAEVNVRLRVTDNGGATDLAVRTLTVVDNQPPTAAILATPNSPLVGEAVSFSAAGSSDADGTIAKYEWDLNGDGAFETTTGTTPSATRTYTVAGDVEVKVRVTDNGGKTASAATTITVVSNGVSNYSPTVLSTPGLAHYWRLNETSGTSFADKVGTSTATTSGGPTLGVAGGVPNDSDKAARFDGVDDAAAATVDLSKTKAVTIEFWMKWNAFANDDRLAMELTKNFNENAGGFLVDPNAPQLSGTFGVGLGIGTSRNNVFFTRPSAGAWHHYAFVLDTTAPAAQQITPYVDGKTVSYTKLDSGTGAGSFANANLYLMSRAAAGLFGAGDLDEVAIYERALDAATIDEHFNSDVANRRPQASFTAPLTAKVGEIVSFDGSASKDPDGSVVKYEWDLDGNGSFETSTGATATATRSYASGGPVVVGLRVTDNEGATGTTTRTVTVEGESPPEEEVFSNYSPTVLDTTGLIDYWRLDETSGTGFADLVGGKTATTSGGPTLGVAGGVPHDSDKAARFDGVDDAATAPVDFGNSSAITVEFWLKWSSYANDDRLAMEFTGNFNEFPGGFLVDPNSPQFGGSFGVGIGSGASRNTVFFTRPSAGAWHHYAFAIDTTAPAASQITPYVDGQPVAYQKADSGSGALAFGKSNLYLMSRAATGLFGAGDLDELALYNRALSGATVAEHFNSDVANKRPSASFQAPASAKVGETVTFDASASKDADGTIVKYEWDLDGNGSYETSTGTSPIASSSYATAAAVSVHLRVTDDKGGTGSAVRVLTVEGEAGPEEEGGTQPTYSEGVLKTSGLLDYWRLGEAVGPALLDSAGANTATASGEPTLGVGGALAGDPNTAVRFDGVDDAATAPVQLGGRTAVTVEFWMKWNAWQNNDELAMELTENFNSAPGGFLVDPNSSYGSFAVGIGIGSSRNVSIFARPSAGAWHHYAFVLDTTAPASEQVIPYVDGAPVAYTKVESGTGASAFADANLYLMSRAAGSLFGAGDLDELALYGRTLSASEVAGHYALSIPNAAPEASFTASPNPALTGGTVKYDASASKDPDGTIAKYLWDLDGNGTFETDTGTAAAVTRTYATAGDRQIGLKVVDNRGTIAKTTRTVTIQNSPPTASFTVSPNPASVGATVNFDASASKDSDGTIVKYEWDLNGDGTYETDTGTTPAISGSYGTVGERTVRLRVTDNEGGVTTATRTLVVQNAPPTASFTATPEAAPTGTTVSFDGAASADPDGTIAKYEWDLDGNGTYETDTGTTASAGTSYATPGARTVGLRVTDNGGATATTTRTVTAQNRAPSASFTATPNPVPTGTSVSLNASASADPDGTIAKYEWDLDSNGTYETNAGTTATISRTFATPGERTIGLRVTDNSGATATTSLKLNVTNRAPTASFTVSPNPAPTGTTVTFNGSGSSDPDGTIAKYEWDLDGNGTFETSTGTTSSTSRSYASVATLTIGLRVTDSNGATATTTRTLTVTNRAPTASFTATPNPALTSQTVSYNAAASADPDGTIAKYEWDLDGNGTYETSTGTTATAGSSYATAGNRTIGLRLTDNLGATATTTRTLTVRGPYENAVRSTAGLIDYWRLGETSGTSLADSVGTATATARNGVTLGSAGNLTLDPNTAASFDGSNDNAAASVNLSGTSKVTIEFWMKWTSFINNDDLAFEFTANNTNNNGAFVINPNSTTSSSRFEVALGRNGSRNNAYFTRPSAGVWHHYAIVLNTTATASQQILVYVDGAAVSLSKGASGTGAGNFANSTLNFMSRNGNSLFGAGTLDEVAIYNQALTATQIGQHYAAR
ncbi:MAG TPA: PKD domain-containing protein [Solirubrobacterales bacterium]